MPTFRTPAAAALVATVACAAPARRETPAPADATSDATTAAAPESLLARAIAHAGGAAALGRTRALHWEGNATVQAGGRTVRIAGTWAVQPPDTAVVATYDVTRGPATMRALVVAAPRGWIVAGDRFDPMPAVMLASERDEFHLYDVMRLVPLAEPGVTLTAIAPDSLGQPGFRAARAGRPPVELWVDADGRLAHLRMRVQDPSGGAPTRQDVWLHGTLDADGVRWPRELVLSTDGASYFALTLRALRTGPRVDDPRLAGPR